MDYSRKYHHSQIKMLRYSAKTKGHSKLHAQRGSNEPVGDNLRCSICKEQFYHAMYLNWHIRNEHMNKVVKVLREQTSQVKPVKLSTPKLKIFVSQLPIAPLPQRVPSVGRPGNTGSSLIKRAPRKLRPAIPNFGSRPDDDFEKPLVSFSRHKKHSKKTTKSSKVQLEGSSNSPSPKKTVPTLRIRLVAPVPQKIKVKTETSKKVKSVPIATVTDTEEQKHSDHPNQGGESIARSIFGENQPISCEQPSQMIVRAKISRGPKPQTCFICYEQLESSWALTQHVKISHKHELGPFGCGNCTLKFRDHSGFLVHFLRKCKDATELGCKYCPRDFNSLTCKELHERRHETITNDDVHECDHCGFVYFRSALLSKHVSSEHK